MCILVPELLGELATTDGYRKLTTVAALSRCHSLIHAAGGIPSLVNLLEEGTVERVMLASAIRAAGPQGDSTLIKVLHVLEIESSCCDITPILGSAWQWPQ